MIGAMVRMQELHDATPEEIQTRLLEHFLSPNYRAPVLPKVAIELSELTRRPNASFDDVVLVLQKDPLVVANVMRVAQSPLYAGRVRLHSLRDAVQRLGTSALRDIVWQVAAGIRLFRATAFSAMLERVQAHSLFVAYATRMVASRAGIGAEHAFLCGLLHDVGISAALIALAETEADVPIMSVLDAIDGMHQQAGRLITQHWGLSPDIAAVVDSHHGFDPNRNDIPLLTAVLCVVEHMAASVNREIMDASANTHPHFDRHSPGRYPLALKRLKLEGKEAELHTRAEEIIERLQALT